MTRSPLADLYRDNRGAAAILVAVMMPVLVGGMGLGAEAGYRYYNQRLLQHAADVSAHAGAVRLRKGDSASAVETAALRVASGSGFDKSIGRLPISSVPPKSGAFTGDPSAVEVILRETRPRLFSAVFSSAPVEIAARAVAAVTGSGASGCILALSGTAAGAVTVTGSNVATLVGCSVVSNSTSPSSISLPSAGAKLTADCISTAGGIDKNKSAEVNTSGCMKTGASPTQDPYYWVQEPPSTCIGGQPRNIGNPGKTTNVTTTSVLPNGVPVGYFCNGIAAKGIINFAPGLYVISGGTMTSSGGVDAQFNGTGVTFFFTNTATMAFGSNSTLNLKAPTTGPYKGILFFGSRTPPAGGPTSHMINGAIGSTMTGAVYLPASHIQFSGNSTTSGGCTQVIANTVTLIGNSTLRAECATAGTTEIGSPTIAVVE